MMTYLLLGPLAVCVCGFAWQRDPVTAADGFTYERRNIERWLSAHNTSPKTNAQLSNKSLVPNTTLKVAIRDFPRTEHERLMSIVKAMRAHWQQQQVQQVQQMQPPQQPPQPPQQPPQQPPPQQQMQQMQLAPAHSNGSPPKLKRKRSETQIEDAEANVKEQLRKLGPGLTTYAAKFIEEGYDDWEQVLAMDDVQLNALAQLLQLKPGHFARLKQHVAIQRSAARASLGAAKPSSSSSSASAVSMSNASPPMLQRGLSAASANRAASDLMAKLDTDGDGVITHAEIAAYLQGTE